MQLVLTYAELRGSLRDLCDSPEDHDASVDLTGACGVCGWYGAMSLSSQFGMLERKVDEILAVAV